MPIVTGALDVSEFDHIIVGAGSAGCAAARRLIDAGRSVALVEAGGPIADERITDIRRIWELWGLETDWGIVSEPLEHADGTVVELPRGKVFGGSSAMYGLVYTRGSHLDYDSWARHGAPGWAWQDVLPVFKRIESFEGGADAFRGADGPMPVNLNHTPNRLTRKFIEAAGELGIEESADYNGAEQMGIAVAQINAEGTTRVTSWDAYLEPVKEHPLLTVLPNTLALRLTFDGARCTGLVVERGGAQEVLRATGDVVLSAGSYQSPQLLMLSGVGPRAELERHGIEVRHELDGVGGHLEDHTLVPIVFEATKPLEPLLANGTECHFFAKSDPGLVVPDLQPIIVAKGLPVRGEQVPEQAFTFLAGVVRPFSRGRVTLASADPHELPRVDLGYFSDPEDLRTMVKAIELCREVAAQDALAEERGAELFPGAEVTGDALEAYVRAQVQTYHHPSGTCRMGRDRASVVDARLRVHGIDGLRVADCSVFPSIPSGNTHAPALLVGERVSDFILDDSTDTTGKGAQR